MKIVIPGGSGQVGTVLARALLREHHEVVVLSAARRAAPGGPRVGRRDRLAMGRDRRRDVVINLAGR